MSAKIKEQIFDDQMVDIFVYDKEGETVIDVYTGIKESEYPAMCIDFYRQGYCVRAFTPFDGVIVFSLGF